MPFGDRLAGLVPGRAPPTNFSDETKMSRLLLRIRESLFALSHFKLFSWFLCSVLDFIRVYLHLNLNWRVGFISSYLFAAFSSLSGFNLLFVHDICTYYVIIKSLFITTTKY